MNLVTGTHQLKSYRPYLVSANVRGVLEERRCAVAPGQGEVGDLVLGVVQPHPGQTVVVLDQDRIEHEFSTPQRVVTVLGPRDSSTHVCATIPHGGVPISNGVILHWVAGESGMVGCLERQPASTHVHQNELAVEFRCEGLVRNAQGRPVNASDFAVNPAAISVSRPIVLVAATSSEAGKTVLTGELIRRLSASGIRVGAIKATGTGGVRDSLQHVRAGAVCALDFVDAGLITTHCAGSEFRHRVPLIFRAMDTSSVDLIIAELGGDILSANNPEVFGIAELMQNTLLLAIISNDALAAAGVIAVNDALLKFPVARIRHFTSPFRNHAGMARRMQSAGVTQCYDPRSDDDLCRIASEILHALAVAQEPARECSSPSAALPAVE